MTDTADVALRDTTPSSSSSPPASAPAHTGRHASGVHRAYSRTFHCLRALLSIKNGDAQEDSLTTSMRVGFGTVLRSFVTTLFVFLLFNQQYPIGCNPATCLSLHNVTAIDRFSNCGDMRTKCVKIQQVLASLDVLQSTNNIQSDADYQFCECLKTTKTTTGDVVPALDDTCNLFAESMVIILCGALLIIAVEWFLVRMTVRRVAATAVSVTVYAGVSSTIYTVSDCLKNDLLNKAGSILILLTALVISSWAFAAHDVSWDVSDMIHYAHCHHRLTSASSNLVPVHSMDPPVVPPTLFALTANDDPLRQVLQDIIDQLGGHASKINLFLASQDTQDAQLAALKQELEAQVAARKAADARNAKLAQALEKALEDFATLPVKLEQFATKQQLHALQQQLDATTEDVVQQTDLGNKRFKVHDTAIKQLQQDLDKVRGGQGNMGDVLLRLHRLEEQGGEKTHAPPPHDTTTHAPATTPTTPAPAPPVDNSFRQWKCQSGPPACPHLATWRCAACRLALCDACDAKNHNEAKDKSLCQHDRVPLSAAVDECRRRLARLEDKFATLDQRKDKTQDNSLIPTGEAQAPVETSSVTYDPAELDALRQAIAHLTNEQRKLQNSLRELMANNKQREIQAGEARDTKAEPAPMPEPYVPLDAYTKHYTDVLGQLKGLQERLDGAAADLRAQEGADRKLYDARLADMADRMARLKKDLDKNLRAELRRFEKDIIVLLENQQRLHDQEAEKTTETAAGRIHFRCLTCDSVTESQPGPESERFYERLHHRAAPGSFNGGIGGSQRPLSLPARPLTADSARLLDNGRRHSHASPLRHSPPAADRRSSLRMHPHLTVKPGAPLSLHGAGGAVYKGRDDSTVDFQPPGAGVPLTDGGRFATKVLAHDGRDQLRAPSTAQASSTPYTSWKSPRRPNLAYGPGYRGVRRAQSARGARRPDAGAAATRKLLAQESASLAIGEDRAGLLKQTPAAKQTAKQDPASAPGSVLPKIIGKLDPTPSGWASPSPTDAGDAAWPEGSDGDTLAS